MQLDERVFHLWYQTQHERVSVQVVRGNAKLKEKQKTKPRNSTIQ